MAKKVEIEVEVPELAEEKRKGLSALIEAMIDFVRWAVSLLFGGTYEDLRSDAAKAKRLAAKAAGAGAVGMEAAGHALDGGLRLVHGAANAVGATLGALLPHQPAGPREIADTALEADRYRNARARVVNTLQSSRTISLAEDPTAVARLVREGAGHLAVRGQEAGSRLMSPQLPSDVSVWLLGLDGRELRAVTAATPEGIVDHLTGAHDLAGVRHFVAPAAPIGNPSSSVVTAAEFDAMLKKARAGFAASAHEAEAASRRGVPHRVSDPIAEDEPALFAPRRRAGPGRY
jgi:hypothetical protein